MTNFYKIIDLQQGSADWHIWRRGKITASMAATIMLINPYETPLQLFNKILSGEETPDNEAMAHGRNTENEAREWLSKACECQYKPVCMESVEHPWLACSLDAWDAHCIEGIQCKSAELKCPISEKNCIYDLSDIPQHYYAQLQHQMAVTGEKKMIFLSYRKVDQSGVILEVKRDDLFIEKMIPLLKAFYDRLAAFEPPDPIDGKDRFEIDSHEACMIARDLRMVKSQRKKIEEEEDRLTQELIKVIDGKSSIIGKNYVDVNCKMTKVLRKGSIDYASIPCLKEIDLESYRKPATTSWRFS